MKQGPNKDETTGFRLEGTDAPKPNVRPFRVPEGYFDGLTPRMMQAVRATSVTNRPTGWVLKYPQLLMPAFGSLLAAVAISAYLFSERMSTSNMAETIGVEDLEEYGSWDENDLFHYVNLSEELLPYEEFEATTVVDYLMEEDIASSSMYANDIIL
jgi:hypothetical protein